MNQHVSRKVCVFNLALASTGVFWKIYQGLRSVLEGSTRFFPPTLYEGAPNVYEELDCALHAIGSGGSISIFLEVLDPVVRSNAHLTALSLRQSCGLVLWHLVPFKKGLQFSQRDCFAIVRDAPGIIIPDFWYCRPLTKKVSRGYSTFSLMRFILKPYFLLFCRGGENQIEAIEKVVSTVIRVFDYRLTLSSRYFAMFHIR